jgi:hypothetical protein
MRTIVVALALATAVGGLGASVSAPWPVQPSTDPSPSLSLLLDRMGAYLIAYEKELTSVVADERFEQRALGRTVGADARPASTIVQRLLESEVAFMRLPGGNEWLSFRDVKKVNGQSVRTSGFSLTELLTGGSDGITQAKTIALAGAAHNLGLMRTINLPTMPLEIVHPSHRQSLRYWLDGTELVRNIASTIVGFEETGRPTIVRQPDASNVVSRGKVWIEPSSGRIPRIEWIYVLQGRGPGAGLPPRVRVEFFMHEGLGILVPARMDEVFAAYSENGSGDATYTNFRRFGTSARLVPQQP